jgi:hypothetical protein
MQVATIRKPLLAALALGALALAAVLVLLKSSAPVAAVASSHSEAPLISQDPRADNTDLYAFVDPNDTSKVTMIANYIPLEAPASGPNFYAFDDKVLYEIRIDNNGDGVPDIGYQFRFTTKTVNPNTFLYGTGPITVNSDGTYANWNRPQTYSVTHVHFDKHGNVIGNPDNPQGPGSGGPGGPGPGGPGHGPNNNNPVVLASNIPVPPDNVGPRTTPSYDSLAANAVTDLGNGVKVFAGQRDDPFFVDLGSIFDLGGLRPFNPFYLLPLAATAGRDALAGYNVHSIVIQVPITQLVPPPATNGTIGIYATASRQKERIFQDDGTVDTHGPWVQISRLGNPLINEALIPLGKKDYWNREDPWNDSQFEQYYTTPELAHLENALYGVPPLGHTGGALAPIDESGRTDLKEILLTGIPGVNVIGSVSNPPDADLLRLNTAIKPGPNGACPGGVASAAVPDRLGALDGDLCGYPNGRRLGDDVIDIDLRAIAQGYGSILNTLLGLPNKSPNNLLGDGVDQNDVPLSSTFPYVASPHSGYDVPGP